MSDSRLFKILYYLLKNGTTPVKELAEIFEVSTRTIHRDIDSLSSAGIPICTSRGRHGGVYIMNNFILDKSVFSAEEKDQILTAINDFSFILDEDANDLLNKLSTIFNTNARNWIEVDLSNWRYNKPSQDIFNSIKFAILDKKIISFEYFNKGESTYRKIEPIKLLFKSYNWYIYGFCLFRNDYRLFKLSRINNLKVLDDTFERCDETSSIVDNTFYNQNLVPVKLMFDKSVSYRVFDEFDKSEIEIDDEFLIVNTNLPSNDYLFSYLLSFGPNVELLEPYNLREEFKKVIKEISRKYFTL